MIIGCASIIFWFLKEKRKLLHQLDRLSSSAWQIPWGLFQKAL